MDRAHAALTPNDPNMYSPQTEFAVMIVPPIAAKITMKAIVVGNLLPLRSASLPASSWLRDARTALADALKATAALLPPCHNRREQSHPCQ